VSGLRAAVAPLLPGVAATAITALAAMFLADHYGAPVMLFALLLGMAMGFLAQQGRSQPGIEFTARQVLRWGVALLGLRISAAQVVALGWQPVAMVGVTVTATIAFGIGLARLLGFKRSFGLLTGGAVGICGASAALAIAATLPPHPRKEQATLFTVIGVSALSTLAMVLYPLVVRLLGLDALNAGLFLGGTIHDVAQVVGAGYSLGHTTGDAATVVKLMRVAMLVPVIAVVAAVARRQHQAPGDARPPLLPGFVVVFVVLVGVNSLGVLPAAVTQAGTQASQAFLVAAMAAIGMKTQLKDLATLGWKPVALMVAETVFLAALFYGLMAWAGMHG